MRTLNFLFVCLLLPTLASAEWKEASDATWHAPLNMAPESTASVGGGVLALDPNFNGGSGWMRFDFNDANGNRDRALAIVPVGCGVGCTNFLMFGYHVNGNTADAVIAKFNRFGVLDSNFGNAGRMKVATTLENLSSVAVDPSATRFYFSGRKKIGALADYDFAVICITDSGVACADFGTLGTVTKWFDLDTNRNDIATKIVYRPAVGANPARLLVGGIAMGGTPTERSYRIGLVAIDPVNGVTQTSFGNAGKVVLQVGEVSDHAYAGLDDMALSAPNMPGGERLYLAGTYKRAPIANNDFDGYVMAINPQDGNLVTAFNGGGMVPIHNDIGPPGELWDEVYGIAVLPDGKVAIVGRSLDANSRYQLLLARVTPNGLDSSFCGGGVCAHISANPNANVSGTSIGARPLTNELVVLSTETRPDGGGQIEVVQVAEQYSALGNTLRGHTEMSYPSAPGQRPNSATSAIHVGSDAAGGYVMMLGVASWNDAIDDDDITVVRMIASDQLFKSGFGVIGTE